MKGKQLTTATATVRSLSAAERTGLGLKAVEDGAQDPGAFEVILSTPDKDREGEEVKAEEWQLPLPGHITFDHDHGMSVATTVGSGTPTLEDGQLVVRGTYASTPLAQTVRSLVADGHIRTTSVAFMRKNATVDGAPVIRRELLNGAFVAVPANPNAVVLSAKSVVAALDDDVEVDEETLGQAVVTASKALHAAVTKALAGSFEERQQAVQYALDRMYRHRDGYAYLLATTNTTAVWRTWSYRDDERAEWQATYVVDANQTVTLGDPVRVRVVEVVTEVTDDTGTGSATEQAAVRAAGADTQDATVKTAPAATEQPNEPEPQGRKTYAPDEDEQRAKALASLGATEQRLAALLAGVS